MDTIKSISRKQKQTRIRKLVNKCADEVEFCEMATYDGLIVSHAEGRRLWFNMKKK